MTKVRDLPQTIARLVQGQRRRSQLRGEIAQLAAMGCLDEVLADAGLLRSQVEPLIAGCADNVDLLNQMLVRCGIDGARLPAEDQRDMMWTCTTCPNKRRCREWLSGRDEIGTNDFCPNAARFGDALSKQQPPLRIPLAAGNRYDGTFRPSADQLRQMQAEARLRETRVLLEVARVL